MPAGLGLQVNGFEWRFSLKGSLVFQPTANFEVLYHLCLKTFIYVVAKKRNICETPDSLKKINIHKFLL